MDVRCRLVTYGLGPRLRWKYGNLGDLFQTVALSRWLPPSLGVLRSREEPRVVDGPFVVNGFFTDPLPQQGSNTLFAGIHVDAAVDIEPFVHWFQESPLPIGVRDPAMTHRLWQYGLPVEMVGCVTLTLPRYEGPREGVYAVDVQAPGAPLTHMVDPALSFAERWRLAVDRLELYRRAERVYASKMHATLPCLAFGTPVTFIPDGIYDATRLSLLDVMGLRPGREAVLDVAPLAERFLAFLRQHLDIVDGPHDPIRPIEYDEYTGVQPCENEPA